MKCFYHSADLDGHCSGELVRRRYSHCECEMVGINYGDVFPWHMIKQGETVYMVDFSLQPWDEMVRLSEMCNLIWIDHHKSAIENSVSAPINCDGVRYSGIGACALTWDFLYGTAMPKAVKLLAEYDVWDHSDPDCLFFQYGMRLNDTVPQQHNFIWDLVFTNIDKVVEDGKIVLKYQTQENEIKAKTLCFDLELDGLKCVAANVGLTNSQFFDSVWDPDKYEAMLTFYWKKSFWVVSLYSTSENVDVSKIAKARGGGGHRGAAGFQCAELPFSIGL